MKNYKIINNEADIKEAFKHVEESEYIAYDTETTGLDVRNDKIIGIAFSGAVGVGYYLPIYKWKDDELQSIVFSQDYTRYLLKELQSKKLIMHNASYDCRITKHDLDVDLLPSLHVDTILLKHTVDEERPFGLKDIAKKIQKQLGLDIEEAANKEQIDMIESIKANGGSVTKDKYELYKADMEKIGIYACSDVDLTLRVFNYYSEKLKSEGLENFFYKDEVMPLLKHVTIPMEDNGIPVDVLALEESQKEITEDIKTLETKIQEMIKPHLPDFERWYLWLKFPPRRSGSFAQALSEHAELNLPKTNSGRFSLTKSSIEQLEPSFYRDYLLGDLQTLPENVIRTVQLSMFKESEDEYMFNLTSKHHLKKLFFEVLNETPVSKTDKGSPQVDHLFLQSIKDKYDFMPLLLDYNKLNKLKSSYIDRILDRQQDGMFYPQFFQHRTISGRYGSDLQQLPRPMEKGQASDLVLKYNNRIRKFFISGDDYVFIDADYESLDPHVFAHVSGDEGLKDIFRTGNDFYSTIAIATESLEAVSADKSADNYLGKVDIVLRQKAKEYSLGIPYGMEGFALSKSIDVRQKEADKLIENYLNAYPALKAWMNNSNKQCLTKGYVKSQAGRVRHLKLAQGLYFNKVDGKQLFNKDGTLVDSLELWKKWHENPAKYKSYKWKRKQLKNSLNNAKNFQIQSLAASITNRACIAIAKELKRQNVKGYICAQIHDQIVVRVPKSYADRWKKTVQYLMENTYKISLDLKAPAKIGENFYDAH